MARLRWLRAATKLRHIIALGLGEERNQVGVGGWFTFSSLSTWETEDGNGILRIISVLTRKNVLFLKEMVCSQEKVGLLR